MIWSDKYIDLSDKAMNVTSQYGEDGIIEAVFEYCPPRNKWCIEVGASDGYTLSNTWSLIQKGWKSVQIEAVYENIRDGELFSGYRKIVERYKDNPNVYPVHKRVGKDDLDEILKLKDYIVPPNLDYLGIDIDSYDAEVWKNLKNYQPNLLVIECNDEIKDLETIHYQLNTPHNAASIGLLKWISELKGYDFLCATECNAFFILPEFGQPLRRLKTWQENVLSS